VLGWTEHVARIRKQEMSADTDIYIYWMINSVVSYMFRPPIVAIFREVFMKDVLPRTSNDLIFWRSSWQERNYIYLEWKLMLLADYNFRIKSTICKRLGNVSQLNRLSLQQWRWQPCPRVTVNLSRRFKLCFLFHLPFFCVMTSKCVDVTRCFIYYHC